jgi:hypothetical protein
MRCSTPKDPAYRDVLSSLGSGRIDADRVQRAIAGARTN